MVNELAKDIAKDSIKEGVNAAYTSISERLNSPLIFSYVLSWSIWNYSFFLIIFSKNSVSQTIFLIEKYEFHSWHAYLPPLVASFLYCFLYPWLDTFISRYRLKVQIKNKIKEAPILGIDQLSVEDSLKIKQQIRDYDKAISLLRRELSIKDDAIIALRKSQTALNLDTPNEPSDQNPQESTLYFETLQKINTSKGGATLESLSGNSKTKEIALTPTIKRLLDQGHIIKKDNGIYAISSNGKNYLSNHSENIMSAN